MWTLSLSLLFLLNGCSDLLDNLFSAGEPSLTTFIKLFGGTGNERGYSAIQTSDGGYILGGYSYSSDGDIPENKGEHDFWIVKLDAQGNL